MPKKNDQYAQLDLNEAIDSLLVEIEKTTNSYTPQEEQAIDSSMMITDDGAAVAPPKTQKPKPEPESAANAEVSDPEPDPEADPEAKAEAEVIDSIENAQQALEALDEVESQAEDLVAQSVDALLESAEASAEDDASEPPTQPVSEAQSPQVDPVPAEDVVDQVDPSDEPEATEEQVDSVEPMPEQETEIIEDSVGESGSKPEVQETAEIPETTDEPAAAAEPVEEATDSQPEPMSDPVSEASEPEVVEIDEAEFDSDLSDTDSLDDSMDMLDSALADAADDMLDGDFETEEGELVSGEVVASEIEKVLAAEAGLESGLESGLETTGDDDILGGAIDDLLSTDDTAQAGGESADPTPQPAQAAAAPAQSAAAESPDTTPDKSPDKSPDAEPQKSPVQGEEASAQDQDAQAEIKELQGLHAKEEQRVPAWFERTIEIVRPKVDKVDPLKGKSMDAIAMVLGSSIVAIRTQATPLVATMMILISKPLANKSPELRNALGFIALWTGFLAVVLWVYLLMFRTPTVPHPETAPTRVISVDESFIVAPLLPTTP